MWRLLLDKAQPGARNMALDEALLLSHAAGESSPTLRFYSWSPSCVSLGRFQAWPFAEAPGFDVVRRPTGGRAVWHQHEITYCAVLREELLPPGARSVVGAYRWLSEGFVAGLQQLGIGAQLGGERGVGESSEGEAARVNCFAAAARCDLTVAGRKLIGAAQCRKQGAVLQHGSILLRYDAAAWRVLGDAAQSVVSLQDLGVNLGRDAIIAALCEGVRAALHVRLENGEWSHSERDMAHALQQRKYAQPGWTRDGSERGAAVAAHSAG